MRTMYQADDLSYFDTRKEAEEHDRRCLHAWVVSGPEVNLQSVLDTLQDLDSDSFYGTDREFAMVFVEAAYKYSLEAKAKYNLAEKEHEEAVEAIAECPHVHTQYSQGGVLCTECGKWFLVRTPKLLQEAIEKCREDHHALGMNGASTDLYMSIIATIKWVMGDTSVSEGDWRSSRIERLLGIKDE